jgi:AbrB family looped-hinge helix DNA binding protein
MTRKSVAGCCGVESLITVDERGQMVLPKHIRDKAGIRGGDKLAVVTWEKDEQVWCVCLIKAAALTEILTSTLGPLLKDMAKASGG